VVEPVLAERHRRNIPEGDREIPVQLDPRTRMRRRRAPLGETGKLVASASLSTFSRSSAASLAKVVRRHPTYNGHTLAAPAALYAINLNSNVTLTINGTNSAGGTFTLDGAHTYRGLLVYAGAVTIQNLTIADATAHQHHRIVICCAKGRWPRASQNCTIHKLS
jgi:hypothetical protein